MPLYLPKNLAGLAALASRDPGRYALQALRVSDAGDGLYRVEVSDGRRLAIVRGPSAPAGYPALETAGNGAASVLVSVADWKSAFRLGGKDRPVGLAATPDALTLAVGDQAIVGKPVEGRFPPVDTVLPASGPLVQFRVDPALLAGLLHAAAALEPEAGVSLLFYGKEKPLGLMCRNGEGQAFDALLVLLR